jgi:hypothetical protein
VSVVLIEVLAENDRDNGDFEAYQRRHLAYEHQRVYPGA